MKRTETIPPCPENGQAPARQHDATLCPPWCEGEHLSTSAERPDGGFHHEGQQWALLPAMQPQYDVDAFVYVSVAQFVPAEGEPQPALVELTDELGSTHRLTPDEAIRVGEALVAAAGEALA